MKCVCCNKETKAIVNIEMKAIPLCTNCSLTISMQTVIYHLSGDFNRDLLFRSLDK